MLFGPPRKRLRISIRSNQGRPEPEIEGVREKKKRKKILKPNRRRLVQLGSSSNQRNNNEINFH